MTGAWGLDVLVGGVACGVLPVISCIRWVSLVLAIDRGMSLVLDSLGVSRVVVAIHRELVRIVGWLSRMPMLTGPIGIVPVFWIAGVSLIALAIHGFLGRGFAFVQVQAHTQQGWPLSSMHP